MLERQSHTVTIYQEHGPVGDFKGPYQRAIVKEYEGLTLISIFLQNNQGADALNMAFNEASYNADLRIYFTTALAFPQVKLPAIAVSHGVFWDSAFHPYAKMSREQKEHFWDVQLRGFTMPDTVVSVDGNVPNVIRSYAPGCESRIIVIQNYVDTEKFKPAPKTWEGIRVLFPRRSTIYRGWNLFFAAVKELPQYQFIACGDAANEYDQNDLEENLNKQIPNFHQEHRHMDDMPSLYQSVDICVIPTLGCEGTSLSACESLACGLPTITTGVGGLNEMILDNHNGIKFDPNHHRLSEVIKYVAEDEELRKRLSVNARQTAIDTFSKERWENSWRQLIPPAKS